MSYDDWKLASPEGEEDERDEGEPEPEIVKECSKCGRTFSREAWLALPYVGPLFAEMPDDSTAEELRTIQRNCTCSSTLAYTELDELE